MAGLTKQLVEAAVGLGAKPPSPANIGYDGVDNGGNGLVDELQENGDPTLAGTVAYTIVNTLLPKHKHKTARSEMLYALLVEGQGPFGSLFSRDDFNDSEVQDTDGDGLLEFVDAWGQPLQFYRWPIGYVSDIADLVSANQDKLSPFLGQQRGLLPYTNIFNTRDQNPLDPGQTLLDPSWWWSGTPNTMNVVVNDSSPFATSQGQLSGSALWFQSNFFALTDPNAPYYVANPPAGPNSRGPWDRGLSSSNYYSRRAYYSKFLVLSGGPDKQPGVPVMDKDLNDSLGFSSLPYFSPTSSTAGPLDLLVECQAAPATPLRDVTQPYLSFVFNNKPSLFPPGDAVTQALIEASKDDISSHNMAGPGGATR